MFVNTAAPEDAAQVKARAGKTKAKNGSSRRGGARSGVAMRNLVRIAMLGAIAFALMYAEFNLPGFPAYLQYDPGDVPTVIGGFAMGPWAGAAVAGVKALIFFLSGKDEAGWVGTVANLATSLAFVLVAAAVYLRMHSKRGAIVGLAAGVAATVVVMAVLNYYVFLPIYGLPAEAIPAAVGTTMLFNLVKGTLNAFLTFLVYKRVSPLLHF